MTQSQRIVQDSFVERIAPYWVRFAVGMGQIEWEPGVIRLALAEADAPVEAEHASPRLSDAQIDDYHERDRRALPWRPPLQMTVRARFSHPVDVLRGTAGFGFWNNPFVGSGAAVAPNTIWFFFASPPSDMALVPGVPGWGWKAASLNGGDVNPVAVAVGNLLLRVPGVARLLLRAASSYVQAAEHPLTGLDVTEWHDYTLFWDQRLAVWTVDGAEVLRTAHPPTVPLGFVAWMDNQWAVMRPQGEIGFGVVDLPQRQWLELGRVQIEKL